MRMSWLWLGAALGGVGLAACGAQAGPWSAPAKAGLWYVAVSEGANALPGEVACYAPGSDVRLERDLHAGKQFGMQCDAPTHKVVAGGWESDAACVAPSGQKVTITWVAKGDAASNLAISYRAAGSDGAPSGGERQIVQRFVGECPSGWKPGDSVDLDKTATDGEWRLVHGKSGNFQVLDSLPTEVAALAPAPAPDQTTGQSASASQP